MRPVHLMDLDRATRVLMACVPEQRHTLANRLVTHARTADRYRQRLQVPHPQFGTGTLRSAAQGYPHTSVPNHCDTAYLSCLTIIIQTLLADQTHQSL